MKFELLPVLNIMLDLYQKPRNFDRFKEYLEKLRGDTHRDLAIPLVGFNPMAKEYLPLKLIELNELHAEQLISESLDGLNNKLSSSFPNRTFKLAINVSDDVHGAWTHRYISDYDSKFKANAFVNRNFCIPIFWASEMYNKEMIIQRCFEYAYRTIFLLANPKLRTLKNHIDQEKYVAESLTPIQVNNTMDMSSLDLFYKKHQDTDNYSVIFNFLYGSRASKLFEFPIFGEFDEMAGFEFAKWKAATG